MQEWQILTRRGHTVVEVGAGAVNKKMRWSRQTPKSEARAAAKVKMASCVLLLCPSPVRGQSPKAHTIVTSSLAGAHGGGEEPLPPQDTGRRFRAL